MAIGWPEALAWRLRRHLLDPVGTASVADVVRRLGAVPDTSAELAVRVRRQRSRAGEVARAVADGSVIRTFAFRGAVHLLSPEDGGMYLALRAASRMWELPSWQSHYGLAPADWPRLREAVRDALADGPVTRDELGAAVTAKRAFRHLGFAFDDGAVTLLKPLAWLGELSFGPPREGRTTFQRLDANPRWAGIPDLDDAGTRAVGAYLRTYGPATPDHLRYWLGEGLGAGRGRIRSWIDALRPAPVEVAGSPALILRDDLDELMSTPATDTVRLLPGYDQWVLGPGTADPHVVPPAHRAVVSRKANLVVAGGVVAGTWSVTGGRIAVTWFPDAVPPPPDALAAETARVAARHAGAVRRGGRGR